MESLQYSEAGYIGNNPVSYCQNVAGGQFPPTFFQLLLLLQSKWQIQGNVLLARFFEHLYSIHIEAILTFCSPFF